MKTENTHNSILSDAELCRRNGWGVGTRLVGDDGYNPTTITITAIGQDSILASDNNYPLEASWTLKCREWEEVL